MLHYTCKDILRGKKHWNEMQCWSFLTAGLHLQPTNKCGAVLYNPEIGRCSHLKLKYNHRDWALCSFNDQLYNHIF